MTAPQAVPVVACDIATWSDGTHSVHPYQHGHSPALAVPDALFDDHDFVQAVWHQWNGDENVYAWVAAVYAELRERAGRPL